MTCSTPQRAEGCHGAAWSCGAAPQHACTLPGARDPRTPTVPVYPNPPSNTASGLASRTAQSRRRRHGLTEPTSGQRRPAPRYGPPSAANATLNS